MVPGSYDFTVVRGTTQPFAFRVTITDPDNPPDQIPIPATAYHLSIKSGSVTLHKRTDEPADNFVYDAGTNTATWTPMPAETRAFKATGADGVAKNSYELEIWNGPDSQMVYLAGKISATGGVNDDV